MTEFQHQDFQESQLRRRASDFVTPPQTACACGKEVLEALQQVQSDLRDIKHGMGTIRTAFVRNDLLEPDYEGHRQAHLKMIERDKLIDTAKNTGTLKMVSVIVGGIVIVFMSGLGVQLQKLLGN